MLEIVDQVTRVSRSAPGEGRNAARAPEPTEAEIQAFVGGMPDLSRYMERLGRQARGLGTGHGVQLAVPFGVLLLYRKMHIALPVCVALTVLILSFPDPPIHCS